MEQVDPSVASDVWREILTPPVLSLLIPIVVIVMVGLVIITKSVIRHRERMAMIEMGLDPDQPRKNVEEVAEAFAEQRR